MEKILVLLHTDEQGALPKAALETLAVAKSLGGSYDLAVVGAGASAAARSCGGGAVRLLAVEGDTFAASRYSTDAAAAAAAMEASGATLVLAPGSMRWARALPGAAARRGGAAETHLTGVRIDGDAVFVSRWYYRQRMEGTLTRPARPWVLLLDPGAADPAVPEPASSAVESLAPQAAPRTEVLGFESQSAGQQTIRPDAQLLLVAGAGWTKKQKDGATHTDQAAELILGLVDKAKASLGSSKSLVDLSGEGQSVLPFLTHLHQVGQTGSTPRHRKGLATCCHGEEPHVVGWRFIHERRAVNLDPNCGWARGKADVLYIADAFEVIAELNKLL